MNQNIKIAYRNVGRQKNRTFLLGGALAFSFFIMTLMGAFTTGLVLTVKDNFTHTFGGHIYITGSELTETGREISRIPDTILLEDVLAPHSAQILETNIRSRARAELIFGSRSFSLTLAGLDFARERDFVDNLLLDEGDLEDLGNPNTILLPTQAMEKLNLKVGETVLVKMDTVTGQRNVAELKVIASVNNQEGLGVAAGYLELEKLNTFLNIPPGSFQTMNLMIRDVNVLDDLTESIYQSLDSRAITERDFEIEEAEEEEELSMDQQRSRMMSMMGVLGAAEEETTWEGTKYNITNLNDITSQLLEIIGILEIVATVIFLVLLIFTMVGVMNSYRMVLLDRISEIGTMRAIGVQRLSVAAIFLWEAVILSVGGTLVGTALAFLVSWVLSLIQFGTEGGMGLFLSKGHLVFNFQFLAILGNMILVTTLTLIGVALPARSAARMRPADALRTTN